MSRTIKFLLLFLILIPIITSQQRPYVCCRDKDTLKEKCFVGGQCCNGKWYERCIDFEIWVAGDKFTIGQPAQLNVYVRNKGAYADTYSMNYEIIEGQILIEWDTNNNIYVPPESDVGVFRPTINILTPETVKVKFIVTSQSNLRKEVIATLSAGSMYSMSEFSLAIILPLLATLIFFMVKRQRPLL
ncbi:MAG: hypothetical protein NZ893_02485 [Candidatus Aenigmarchaeota archaeon]|nr:hypothetical protein [Candidatus Aenigmarchaeota archaeon]